MCGTLEAISTMQTGKGLAFKVRFRDYDIGKVFVETRTRSVTAPASIQPVPPTFSCLRSTRERDSGLLRLQIYQVQCNIS